MCAKQQYFTFIQRYLKNPEAFINRAFWGFFDIK